MQRLGIWILVLLGGVGAASCHRKLQKNLARVDWTLDQYVKQNRVAGVVALVLRDGKPIYERATGWSDREAARPMRMDTIFRIASMTKAMTSAGVLMLVEEKKINLRDSLAKYMPEFGYHTVAEYDEATKTVRMVGAGRQITIHDLLTHTSGYSYGVYPPEVASMYQTADLGPATGGWNLSGKAEPICETVSKLAHLPLSAQPGTWVYGYSTDILGCVIEKAAKMDLDTFFKRYITEPLNMRDTHFFLPPVQKDRLAALYGTKDGKAERNSGNVLYPYVEGPRKSFSGGAGLVSTAIDYARFLEMIRMGGILGKVRIMKPETVKLMTTSQLGGNPPLGFSYGFETTDQAGARGLESVGSYGWMGAYGTMYRVDPRQRLVIVFMNQLAPDGTDIQARFWESLYQAFADAKELF